jgi:two-component sensor histidine kinase
MVALGLIAAIPAVGMAGIIAGQDYQSRERVAIEHVDRLQGLAIARFDGVLAALDASLQAIAAHVPRPAVGCSDALIADDRAAIHPTAAMFYAPDGHVVCHVGAQTPLNQVNSRDAGWFTQAVAGAAPALGMAFGHTVAASARSGSVLAMVLPPDWFNGVGDPEIGSSAAAIWLFDPVGHIAASSGESAKALPSLGTLLKLQHSKDETLLAASAGGEPYAYAATRLPNGWQLIGAYGSAREHIKAQRVLYTRLVYLAVLLLLGLAVTVLGADIAFGGPLRRLRTALADWQAGVPFDPRALDDAPTELIDLARSFNEATIRLREQKAALDQAQERQALLILEIHHRVKNNLQIVASLLNLQASRIRVPEARAEFQAARDRVRALATLHRHLYSEGEIHTINMPSFLNELCGQLFQAMGEQLGGRIELLIKAQEIRLSTDHAVPMALIVTEAVTNAIKYGFPGGRPGTISILLEQHDAAIDMVIADDGVGIPPGRGETESGTRDGLGLQLIRGFSRQLGATLEVTEQPGTRYSIHMPMRHDDPNRRDHPSLDEAS